MFPWLRVLPCLLALNLSGSILSLSETVEPLHMLQAEPLGPSSRRTGIAISEIMFHPAPRTDGRDIAFIELYNSNPFFEDLSGWRLSGDIEFTFPTNTILAGNAFTVIASNAADLRAVSGITNIIGSYRERLGQSGGTVRLQKRSGAIVLEVNYDSEAPWPAAAAGAGASLVLARPSLGEDNPYAWDASARLGGSPGTAGQAVVNRFEGVRINELQTAPSGSLAFVELCNQRATNIDVSDCRLVHLESLQSLKLPSGTVLGPKAYLLMPDLAAAFTNVRTPGTYYLLDPEGLQVIDAFRASPHGPGRSVGRWPNGNGPEQVLIRASPSHSNVEPFQHDVVINEIMYHPMTEKDEHEYLELFNRGTNAVDLSGWRLTDGVTFTFPPGTALPAGGYLVIGKEAQFLLSTYSHLNAQTCIGNYSGSLANNGERIALSMPIASEASGSPGTTAFLLVDEVTYSDGGRWGRWSDGDGSSLELIDARSDNRLAPNWTDSDESAKSAWKTIEASGAVDLTHPGVVSADQLQVMLLGAGEMLVDNVEVLVGAESRIGNGTFENGAASWFFQGTHRLSRPESEEGDVSSRSLRLVASDRGDHVVNRARALLSRPITPGTRITIRARVRWLRGHPEILFRLRNGGMEAAGAAAIPTALGTPGLNNSRAVANAGPAITGVAHYPVLPRANEPITVTALVQDRDGVHAVTVHYRLDPATEVLRAPARDDGAGMDAVAGDGVFTGVIPGQRTGQLVAFSIEANDGSNEGVTTQFPNDAPERECLIRIGETTLPGTFGTYRIWLTQASLTRWSAREKMSNEDIDATFVYGTNRVIYNAGAHYSGSSYTSPSYTSPVGALCGYDLAFPPDDKFLGETEMTLDWPIRDSTDQREQLMFWFLEQYRLPNMYRRYVHLFVNGIRRGTIYDDVQQPSSDTVHQWWPDDDEGTLLKTDVWNEFGNTGTRIDPLVLNTLEIFNSGGVKKVGRYRWNWRPRAAKDSTLAFADLFRLVDAMNATSNYIEHVRAVVDVDHWMRTFAMNDLASYWDGFGNPNAKNTFLYKPVSDGWKLMCWDFDVGLGVFNDPVTAPLFDVRDPTITSLYRTPAFVRVYWGALEEAVNSWFRTGPGTGIDSILDAKFAAFRANTVALSSPAPIKSWINQRRAFLISQLNSVRAQFEVTNPMAGGGSTSESPLTVSGTAPVNIHTIRINGLEAPVSWSTITNWSAAIVLQPGTNSLTVQGVDRFGIPLSGASATLQIRYTGTRHDLPLVRINEWMSDNTSAVPYPFDGTYPDWFELVNLTEAPIALGGWSLTDAPDNPRKFVIPSDVVLAPGSYLTVWADERQDRNPVEDDLHVNFRLAQSGETLALFDPAGRLADIVTYLAQESNQSTGRWPDASEATVVQQQPTPGQPNSGPLLASIEDLQIRLASPDTLEITWTSVPGGIYEIEAAEDLDPSSWKKVSGELTGSSSTAAYIVKPAQRRQFFRVRRVR